MDQGMRDERLSEVIACFALPSVADKVWVAVAHAKPQGFSEAKIWQLQAVAVGTEPVGIEQPTDSSFWCLRSWPIDQPGADRLRWIHRQLQGVAATCPFIVTPVSLRQSSETFIQFRQRLWQVERWATGNNNFNSAPSEPRLTSVMHALARLHSCWLDESSTPAAALLGEPKKELEAPQVGPSPGLQNRWVQWSELAETSRLLFTEARRGLHSLTEELGESHLCWSVLIDRIEQAWSENSFRVRGMLEQRDCLPLPLGPVLADVWSDHLFFEGDQLSAIIDYGGMRNDTAAADLSRCLTSLCGQGQSQRQWALQQYETVRPLAAVERIAIDVFDDSSRLLGPLHWLRWLFVERRLALSEAILGRLQCLVEGQPF
jgi:hypothetical protein